jgi:GT2 family glycosyltransferase
MASPHVGVVVLNYNGLADTLRCLESLEPAVAPNVTVVLVDNASDENPIPAAAGRFPGVVTIRNGANLGYAGGNNRGIAQALAQGAKYVLVLNNDTVVSPDIVTQLVAAFEQNPTLGIVGPVINDMDDPDRVMTDGTRFNAGPSTDFFTRLPVSVGARTPALVPVDIVNGCCMMISAAVLREVGLFDERLFIVHEESDLCLRAKARGFRCAILGKTLVWHKGSSSFERTGRRIQRYYDTRNLYFLLRRYAGRATGSRSRAVSWWHFLHYAFYRYAIELENGKRAAADAVIDGLWDAVTGHVGEYRSRRRPGLSVVRAAFDLRRRFAL